MHMSDVGTVPIAPIFGALYFCAVMSTAFYGVACMQTFFYYTHYRDDPLRAKTLVATLWALNTIHEALTICGTYKFIMAGLMSQGLFVDGFPELITQMLFTGLVALPTQGFFIYRIYIFSGKQIVAPFLWLPLAIYQLVADLIYVVTATRREDGVGAVQRTFVLNNTFNMAIYISYVSVTAGVDILIAIFMTLLLVRERTHTPTFKTTALLLQRLTIFAVNSGIWTAIFSILSAILMYVFQTDLVFSVFATPLCSIYCNTLLANLNARVYLRVEPTTHNVGTDMFVMSVRAALDDTESNSQS